MRCWNYSRNVSSRFAINIERNTVKDVEILKVFILGGPCRYVAKVNLQLLCCVRLYITARTWNVRYTTQPDNNTVC